MAKNWFPKNTQFPSEGGRACYFSYNHAFCTQALLRGRPWSIEKEVVIITSSKERKVNWYFIVSDSKSFDYAYQRVEKNPKFLEAIEKATTSIADKTVKKLREVNWQNISKKELISLYTYYINQYHEIGVIPGFLRTLDRAVIMRLKDLFKNSANPDNLIAESTLSKKPSYGRREEIALLEVASRLKKNNVPESEKNHMIREIHDKFCWSSLGYLDEEPKNEDWYRNKISEYSKDEPLNKLSNLTALLEAEQTTQVTLKKKFRKESALLIDTAAEAVFLKDHYKFYVNKMQYFAEALFDKLSEVTGEEKSFLKDLLLDEMDALLSGKKLNRSKIEERIRHYVFFIKDGKEVLLTGKEADDFEDMYLKSKANASKEFKGRVACKGKVKGIVKVILGQEDFHKLKQGEILVTTNTSPDFVPILKNAVAIIAEDGGITAHASVVSREFSIPCIVGIYHISKILKDGDMVEVDANSGTVRIIKP